MLDLNISLLFSLLTLPGLVGPLSSLFLCIPTKDFSKGVDSFTCFDPLHILYTNQSSVVSACHISIFSQSLDAYPWVRQIVRDVR